MWYSKILLVDGFCGGRGGRAEIAFVLIEETSEGSLCNVAWIFEVVLIMTG